MKRFLILCFCGFLLSGSAWAQGHMLHGVGPINSSMGGAGTGLHDALHSSVVGSAETSHRVAVERPPHRSEPPTS